MAHEPIDPLSAVSALGAKDVVIVTTLICEDCYKPHLTKISATTVDPAKVVAILSLAIIDIVDKSDVIAGSATVNDHHGLSL